MYKRQVYYDVIRKKTAALFTASAEAGAISVHASDEMVKNARLFGEMIGIAIKPIFWKCLWKRMKVVI